MMSIPKNLTNRITKAKHNPVIALLFKNVLTWIFFGWRLSNNNANGRENKQAIASGRKNEARIRDRQKQRKLGKR